MLNFQKEKQRLIEIINFLFRVTRKEDGKERRSRIRLIQNCSYERFARLRSEERAIRQSSFTRLYIYMNIILAMGPILDAGCGTEWERGEILLKTSKIAMSLGASAPGTMADYKYPVGGYATRKRSRFEQQLLLMRTRNVETESSRESGNIRGY